MKSFKKYGKYLILFSASILLFILAIIIYLDDPSKTLVLMFLILIGLSLIFEELVRPHLRHHRDKGKHQ